MQMWQKIEGSYFEIIEWNEESLIWLEGQSSDKKHTIRYFANAF